jgi:uncharacterized protein with PIN domain
LKKRSAANLASRKRPKELIFFLDRQLGRYKMAAVLRAAGLHVEIHDDHFRQDALDPEWLTAVSERNWIVVTRDERIRYRVAEKQAIRRAKVRAFVLVAQGDLRAEIACTEFSCRASEDSEGCRQAKAAVYRKDFTQRRRYCPRLLIAPILNLDQSSRSNALSRIEEKGPRVPPVFRLSNIFGDCGRRSLLAAARAGEDFHTPEFGV